jgi:membrane protein DedA with SNARE-associated domain
VQTIVGAIGALLHRYGYGAIVAFFVFEGSGIPVPSETMLVTAAAFAAHGTLHLRYVLLAATIGGILGGHAGFAIGRFGGLPLVRRFGRLFRLDEEGLARGRTFFAQRGAGAVFLSKNIAFLRIIVPMLAGVAQMSFARFSLANAAGAVVSALVYGSLGYVFGRDLSRLEHHVTLATIATVSLIGAVVLVRAARRRIAQRRGTLEGRIGA